MKRNDTTVIDEKTAEFKKNNEIDAEVDQELTTAVNDFVDAFGKLNDAEKKSFSILLKIKSNKLLQKSGCLIWQPDFCVY